MDCACHCEPAYWQKDSRMRAGGWWRCAVAKRAQQLVTDRARADVKSARAREEHHRPGGGYYRRRKRALAQQRGSIVERLKELEQEATACL